MEVLILNRHRNRLNIPYLAQIKIFFTLATLLDGVMWFVLIYTDSYFTERTKTGKWRIHGVFL